MQKRLQLRRDVQTEIEIKTAIHVANQMAAKRKPPAVLNSHQGYGQGNFRSAKPSVPHMI